MKTLKTFLAELQQLTEKHPECIDYPIIYSHDDEGNEYQTVVGDTTLCQVENLTKHSYKHLDIVGFYSEGATEVLAEDCNAVIIN